MEPLYIDSQGRGIFTTDQIDIYGLPELNGWSEKYFVIESRELVFKPTFEQEQNLLQDQKPVHRYCRVSRFKTCLFQLTGHIGFVGKSIDVVDDVCRDNVTQFNVDYLPPCLVWEYFRQILKKEKLQIFYNRIPAIARGNKMVAPVKISTRQANNILDDFQLMHEIFPRIRHKLNRKYFPSLRATALLLLDKYKVNLSIKIPIARNPRKALELRETFDTIWKFINEEMFDFYFD